LVLTSEGRLICGPKKDARAEIAMMPPEKFTVLRATPR
jgi:hypothetical protein